MGLFDEQVSRKPNLYPKTQEFIDVMWAGAWTPNEFDFKSDVAQFKAFDVRKQGVIIRTLSAIGQIEVAIKKFWSMLGIHLPHPSIGDLGFVMSDIEVRHNIAYEKLLNSLGLEDIFEENLKEPVIRGRVEYLRKYLSKAYLDDKKQFIYALILFTLFVENVSLFSQFYIILWFRKFQNELRDTAQQVEYTRNEEAIHAQVGIWLINTLRQEYPELFDEELEARIKEEVSLAHWYESQVIDWILDGYSGEGLDADLLKQYIGTRIKDSMSQIGYTYEFDAPRSEEFKWMDEELLGYNMTDFFASKDKGYSKNNKVWDIDVLD